MATVRYLCGRRPGGLQKIEGLGRRYIAQAMKRGFVTWSSTRAAPLYSNCARM